MRFAPIRHIVFLTALSIVLFMFPSDVQAAVNRTGINSEQLVNLSLNTAPAPTSTPDFCGFGCGSEYASTSAPGTLSTDGQVQYETGVVKLILFWMEGCPFCDELRETTVPQVENAYGEDILVNQIELETVDDVDLLYVVAREHGLENEEIGVPFLMIGQDIRVGYDEINTDITGLIEKYLQSGGTGYPANPQLDRFLPADALPAESGAAPTSTPEQPATSNITIHFFWGDGCPHCAEAKPVLEEMVSANPRVELEAYEVYYVPENQARFQEMAAELGFEPHAVPTIIIGDQYWEGWSDLIQSQIESAVQEKLAESANSVETPDRIEGAADENVLTLPLLGTIDLSKQSLVVSTLLISFVDGFNPCSIWVLTLLLSITLQTKSRKKILIIGLVFISVTAAIYALFIAGLFSVLTFASFTGWIQVVVALAALFFALVNIKDYFWYKEGISFTIDESKKPGIYKRIRKILDAGDSIWSLIAGTVVLAAGVSMVEFTCTAGFPVLWTNMLASQEVTMSVFIVLLLVYMLVYQLDELVIFLVAVFTLRSSRLEEKHGRILKLVGGMLMLTLAAVMLINPGLMSDLGSALLVFVIAFAATLWVLLAHRYILPALGVHIGTEFSKQNRRKAKKRHG